MNRGQLEHAIRAAGAISGDRELYVVGSQSILGAFPGAHPDLCRSMEVDIAPKNYPEREALGGAGAGDGGCQGDDQERPSHSGNGSGKRRRAFSTALLKAL